MEFLKEGPISQKEVELLRERFINQYSIDRGWDPKNLTTQQLLEITQHKGYKNPGLILG